VVEQHPAVGREDVGDNLQRWRRRTKPRVDDDPPVAELADRRRRGPARRRQIALRSDPRRRWGRRPAAFHNTAVSTAPVDPCQRLALEQEREDQKRPSHGSDRPPPPRPPRFRLTPTALTVSYSLTDGKICGRSTYKGHLDAPPRRRAPRRRMLWQ